MNWLPIWYHNEGPPWIEAVVPLGMVYAVAPLKRKFVAELLESGGGIVWSTKHKTHEAAVSACEAHAEEVAREWNLAVGELLTEEE